MQVRFEYCDLSIQTASSTKAGGKAVSREDVQTPNYKFYYNNDARMLANADIPKRSLAIAKEVRLGVLLK